MVCELLLDHGLCNSTDLGTHLYLLFIKGCLFFGHCFVRDWIGGLWCRAKLRCVHCWACNRGHGKCRDLLWSYHHHLSGCTTSQAAHNCRHDGIGFRHFVHHGTAFGRCLCRQGYMALVFLYQVSIQLLSLTLVTTILRSEMANVMLL